LTSALRSGEKSASKGRRSYQGEEKGEESEEGRQNRGGLHVRRVQRTIAPTDFPSQKHLQLIYVNGRRGGGGEQAILRSLLGDKGRRRKSLEEGGTDQGNLSTCPMGRGSRRHIRKKKLEQ